MGGMLDGDAYDVPLRPRVEKVFGNAPGLLGKTISGTTDWRGSFWIDFTDGTQIRIEQHPESRNYVLTWEDDPR